MLLFWFKKKTTVVKPKHNVKDPTINQKNLSQIMVKIGEKFNFNELLKKFFNFLIEKSKFFLLKNINSFFIFFQINWLYLLWDILNCNSSIGDLFSTTAVFLSVIFIFLINLCSDFFPSSKLFTDVLFKP